MLICRHAEFSVLGQTHPVNKSFMIASFQSRLDRFIEVDRPCKRLGIAAALHDTQVVDKVAGPRNHIAFIPKGPEGLGQFIVLTRG